MPRNKYLVKECDRVVNKLKDFKHKMFSQYGQDWTKKCTKEEGYTFLELLELLDECGPHSYE